MCPPISTAKLLWGTVTILQVIALRLQTQPSSGQRLATVLAPQLPVNHCAQLTDKRINTMCCVYTMESYLARKINEGLTRMKLEHILYNSICI